MRVVPCRRPAHIRVPRALATRCIASGKPHQYDGTASSGPVVANDPVDRVDPTGLEQFEERKYRGANRQLVHVIDQVVFGKGNQTGSIKVGGNTYTINELGKTISVSATMSTPVGQLSIATSGTFNDARGKEGFSLSNVKILGGVHTDNPPGDFRIFSGTAGQDHHTVIASEADKTVTIRANGFLGREPINETIALSASARGIG